MPRNKATRTLSPLIALILMSCASAPNKGPASPASVGSCPAGPNNGRATTKAPPTPQESLIEHVPAQATAAVIIRSNLLRLPHTLLDEVPGLRVELARFLSQRVGVDLTAVESMVAYATRLAPRPDAALLLRMKHAAPTRLKGTVLGKHRGVEIVSVGGPTVAALIDAGVVIGTRGAVELTIARRPQPGGAGEPQLIKELRAIDAVDVDGLVAVDLPSVPPLARPASQFDLRVGSLTLDNRGLFAVRIAGDPAKLSLLKGLLQAGLAAAIAKADQQMATATQTGNVVEGVGAITAAHIARHTVQQIEPKLEGDHLVSSYRMPDLGGAAGMTAVVGMMAAVAIPSFIKYMRKAKTAEASINLNQIRAGLESLHASASSKRGFKFPATTPWTPAMPCCASASKPKCAAGDPGFEHASWKAVVFRPPSPHFYQYRIVSAGRGKQARVTIEARGDLDCDGKSSSYRLPGRVNDQGQLEFLDPIVTDATE